MKKLFTRSLLAASFVLASSASMAMSKPPQTQQTDIVFTNSSLETIQVQLQGNAEASLVSSEVPPLATRTLAKVTRNQGTNTNLDIVLTAESRTFELTQATSNLDIRFSAEGSTWNMGEYSDENLHKQAIPAAEIAFKADDLGDGGKIEYVFQTNDQKPNVLGDANSLSLLSYNVWATTIFGSKKVSTRLTKMPEVMSGHDVLVLTEVFDLIPGTTLIKTLKGGEYPYHTHDGLKLGKIMKSGTRIVSRWPILEEERHYYNDCNGIQCAASRAVIYAKIDKLGKTYHVFATHTQSSDDDANRQARLAQLRQMGEYITSKNIPANEPVILAGDFNVNKIGLPEDRDYMESVLSAVEPTNLGHNLTFDSNTNHWAEKPYLEYLDYTLYSTQHQQPVEATQRAFAPRAITEDMWGIWDLSDHYAVRGLFKY